MEQGLVDEIDDELARVEHVPEGVLVGRGARPLPTDADRDDGRVLREDVEEAVGRGVAHPVRPESAHERDRSGHDEAGEELVALAGVEVAEVGVPRPPGLLGVRLGGVHGVMLRAVDRPRPAAMRAGNIDAISGTPRSAPELDAS